MTTLSTPRRVANSDASRKTLLQAIALIAVMTIVRAIYAGVVDLRTDGVAVIVLAICVARICI